MASTQTDDPADPTSLYVQLDSYPWATDEEFQGGLRAILGSVNDPSQIEHLTLRAKCYYYARKASVPVDFDGYKRWVEGHNSLPSDPNLSLSAQETSEPSNRTLHDAQDPATASAASSSSSAPEGNGMADAPRPATFAEICDMIAEGKPIPGIKEIPDTILEGQASEANRAQRRKPWERDELRAFATPSWIT